jgi:hypothetical protein
MKKNLLTILIFVSFLMNINCNGQENISYHKFEPTASDFGITKWDISQKDSSYYYLTEKVDSKNRVTELKFYENGKSSFDHLCYLQTWVKYEYPDDTTIIQTNLNSEGIPEANIECELPSKIIYHLSENKKSIISTEYEYEFDHIHYQKIGWTKEFLSGIITELESHESNASIIDFYSKSLNKLNGIFPVNNEFDIDTFYFSTLEKEKIINGIK